MTCNTTVCIIRYDVCAAYIRSTYVNKHLEYNIPTDDRGACGKEASGRNCRQEEAETITTPGETLPPMFRLLHGWNPLVIHFFHVYGMYAVTSYFCMYR